MSGRDRINIDEGIQTLARSVEAFSLQSKCRRIEEELREGVEVNIDDRLEALAQSVELLSHNSRDSDKRMDEQGRRMDELGQRMDQLRQSVAELVANSDRLWMLYTSQDRNLSLHERRLDEHDNRLHDLDGGQPPHG